MLVPSESMRKSLRMAHMIVDPKVFLQRVVRQSLMLSVGLTVFLFFILSKATGPAIIILIFPLCFVLSFVFFSNEPLVQIRRRAKEIDSEHLDPEDDGFSIREVDSGFEPVSPDDEFDTAQED